jgi:rubrerythrin
MILEDINEVRKVLQAPLQNSAEAELQSIESLIATTKEDIARRVEDMLELRGYARQLMANKLKTLEMELCHYGASRVFRATKKGENHAKSQFTTERDERKQPVL